MYKCKHLIGTILLDHSQLRKIYNNIIPLGIHISIKSLAGKLFLNCKQITCKSTKFVLF